MRTVTVRDAKKVLRSVTYAMATDEVRPAVRGLYLRLDRGALSAVATDWYRLAMASTRAVDYGGDHQEWEVVLPLEAADVLQRAIPDGATVDFGLYNGRLIVQLDSNITQLSMVYYQAEHYPDYRRWLDESRPVRASVDREPLLAAVRTAEARVRGGRPVRLTLSTESVTIEPHGPSAGEAPQSVPAVGPTITADLSLVVNSRYLRQALEAASDARWVLLEAADAKRALAVRTIGTRIESVHLIMPMTQPRPRP